MAVIGQARRVVVGEGRTDGPPQVRRIEAAAYNRRGSPYHLFRPCWPATPPAPPNHPLDALAFLAALDTALEAFFAGADFAGEDFAGEGKEGKEGFWVLDWAFWTTPFSWLPAFFGADLACFCVFLPKRACVCT